jgi:hypothetical protein
MKMENKMKNKIGALVVIGLVLVIFIATPVSAEQKLEEDDTKVSVNDSGTGGYISWHLDATEHMRLTGGRLGIGDTSPDFKLEVTGSSGSGYFGVSSSSYLDFLISCILDLFF